MSRFLTAHLHWLVLLAAVLVVGAACGGDDSSDEDETSQRQSTQGQTATAEPQTPENLPEGWTTFSRGGFEGAVGPEWDYYVLSRDEYIEIAREGLERIREAGGDIGELDEDQLVDAILLVLMEEDGYPNVNVQPCIPEAESRDIEPLAEAYREEWGISVTIEDEVEYEGNTSDVLKMNLVPDLDTYQAIVGDTGCYSVVTLTTDADDQAAVDDWKAFMENLHIDPDR